MSGVSKVHVDKAGDYVVVPQEDFDSMVRTLELLSSDEFKDQFDRSRDEEGKSIKQLKEKYGIED